MSDNTDKTDGSRGNAEGATPTAAEVQAHTEHKVREQQREIGGRDGPEPTRFGDWEKNGRCIDF